MNTVLFNDTVYGTKVEFIDRPSGESEVVITVAAPPFSKHTIRLDLDDVDRLLAVREHAVDPVLDIADFFSEVYGTYRSKRAAEAFVAAAGSLGEIIR